MNLGSLNDSVLKNLSLWLNTSPTDLKSLGDIFPNQPNSYYENILDCQVISTWEGLVRRLTHKIVKFLKADKVKKEKAPAKKAGTRKA